MIDWTLFTVGALFSAAIAGVLSGLWLIVFHPVTPGTNIRRRSLLQGWYFALPLSILYAARLATGTDSNAPRLVSAWILALLFAAFVAVGAYLGSRARLRFGRE